MPQAEIEVTKITHPIAADDFCECVTFPDSGDYEFVKCTADSYWSTFSIYLSDDTCYDITFLDSSEVYSECAYGSDMSSVLRYLRVRLY
ncbi:hypothetical protein P3T76_008083 [Phytophthora citrophthora]|uniref:Uncharacterized protein n=1 Tax=Phytophthora citrophthora TaxID=4793 RepID=A0AAD9GLG3_9STRA|nr:hypothetical protein P3T76_008083 [Phytophthora citrophthora]